MARDCTAAALSRPALTVCRSRRRAGRRAVSGRRLSSRGSRRLASRLPLGSCRTDSLPPGLSGGTDECGVTADVRSLRRAGQLAALWRTAKSGDWSLSHSRGPHQPPRDSSAARAGPSRGSARSPASSLLEVGFCPRWVRRRAYLSHCVHNIARGCHGG